MELRGRVLGTAALALLMVTAAPGCDCDCGGGGGQREAATPARAPDAQAAPAPEPAETPAPTPPSTTGQNEGTLFGVASVTFSMVEGRPSASVRIPVPGGAVVSEGQVQTAAIYFDSGPPISAALTVTAGTWQSPPIRLPDVVKTAQRATLRIPTRPQTTFVWEVAGAWQTAEAGPVTLESGR